MPPYVRCGITVIAQGEPAAFASTGLPAEVLDEAGHAGGDGPCIEAVRTRDIVLSQRPGRRGALAGLGRRGARGTASRRCCPTRSTSTRAMLGALNLYADRPEAFEGELPIIAMLRRRPCEPAASGAAAPARARRTWWPRSSSYRWATATVERAIGIVMAQRGCPPEQALRHLHEAATHLGVGLPAVAERLVRTVSDRRHADVR